MDCMKQGYVSKKDAKKAAILLKKLGVTGTGRKGTLIKRNRLTPYLCKRCTKEYKEDVWHLSSKK